MESPKVPVHSYKTEYLGECDLARSSEYTDCTVDYVDNSVE